MDWFDRVKCDATDCEFYHGEGCCSLDYPPCPKNKRENKFLITEEEFEEQQTKEKGELKK